MANIGYEIKKLEDKLYLIKAPGAPQIKSTLENQFYLNMFLERVAEQKVWDELSKKMLEKPLNDLLNKYEINALITYFRGRIGALGKFSEYPYILQIRLLNNPKYGKYLKSSIIATTILYGIVGLYSFFTTKNPLLLALTFFVIFDGLQMYFDLNKMYNQRFGIGPRNVICIANEAFRLGIPLEGELPENLRKKFPEFYNLIKEKGLEKYPLRSYILWRIYRESQK